MKPSPWIAAALSMLAPGLGQLASGKPARGLVWFAVGIGGLGGFLWWVLDPTHANPVVGAGWIAAMAVAELGSWIDAYRCAGGTIRLGAALRSVGSAAATAVLATLPLLFAVRRPRAGAAAAAALVGLSVLAWARRRAPPRNAGLACALSTLFPGLGQAYLHGRGVLGSVWAAIPLLAPGLLLFTVGAVEEPPVAGWPAWLMHWPDWLSFAAGGALSGAAIVHAWIAGRRRADEPAGPPRLPVWVWILAALAWLNAQLPWEGWLKDRLVRSFKIPSSSMEPTLLVDDRLWARRTAEVRRGDIVVFRPPDNPGVDYIKRVVALPGETVRLRNGKVLVNGRALEEPYAVHQGPGRHVPGRDEFGPVTVTERCYFLLGDNRDNSRDSRYFGFVPVESIYGRAYKLFWPVRRVGPLK